MPITLHTDAIEAGTLPEQTELAAGRIRDEFQQAIDKDVEALKMDTAVKGWPDHDPGHLFRRYVTDKKDRAELKSVIRRAANLFHVEPVFYKDATTEAGHMVIKFHVARKVDKDGKPVKDESLTADGKPTAAALKAFKESRAA